MPHVELPRDILPSDGRFGCGPSKVRPAQLEALAGPGSVLLGTSHRQAPVKDLVGQVRSQLGDLFRAPTGYEVIVGNGGSTAFWDAAAFGLIEKRSQNLVFGEFGGKFAAAAKAPWLEAPDVREVAAGTRTVAEAGRGRRRLRLAAQRDLDRRRRPDHPRARRRRRPHRDRRDERRRRHRLLGARGRRLLLRAAEEPRLGRRPLVRGRLARPPSSGSSGSPRPDRYIPEFLSLKNALDNSRLNQTLNTPALSTLILLDKQLEWIIASGGIQWADARTRESSQALYDWAEASAFATPFVADPADRSPVVVTIDFDETVDAAAVAKSLRANGIVDTEPYRKLGRNQLRVATFVSIEPEDVRQLIRCIDYTVDALR